MPVQEVIQRATAIKEGLSFNTAARATMAIDVTLPPDVPGWLGDFGAVTREAAPASVSFTVKVKVRRSEGGRGLPHAARLGLIVHLPPPPPPPPPHTAQRWLWSLDGDVAQKHHGERFDVSANKLQAYKARDNSHVAQLAAHAVADAALDWDTARLELRLRIDVLGLEDDQDRIGVTDESSKGLHRHGVAVCPRNGYIYVNGSSVRRLPGPALQGGAILHFAFDPQAETVSVSQHGGEQEAVHWRKRTGARIRPALALRRVGWRISVLP